MIRDTWQRELVKMAIKAVSFPYPQICVHLVAADILSLLERHGVEISQPLAKAVVEADDEKAIQLLNELLEPSVQNPGVPRFPRSSKRGTREPKRRPTWTSGKCSSGRNRRGTR